MRTLLVLATLVARCLMVASASAEEACPSKEAVALHLVDDAARRADFQVVDEGEAYAVSFGAERRVFVDKSRSCATRAKIAAVAVTSLVSPPSATPGGPLALGAPPPSPPPPPAPEAPPPPRAAGAAGAFRLRAGVGVDFSPGSGGHDAVVAAGLQLRALWLPGWLSGRVGIGTGVSAFLPTTFRAGPADVRLTRGVLDLSGHYSVPIGALRLTPALGPAVELHDVRGTGPDGAGDLRALLGVRGGFEAAVLLTRSFGLALDLSALVLPVTGDLALHQSGVVGKEPSIYLGLGVGLLVLP